MSGCSGDLVTELNAGKACSDQPGDQCVHPNRRRQLERQLAGPIAQGRVQLLSISFDPTQDPPAELAAYLRRFRGQDMGGWQAARPLTADGLQSLTAAFGVTIIQDRLGGYTHNAAIHLVDPEGRLVDIFDLGDLDQIRGAILRKLSR